MYGDSRENLLEILAVVVVFCPVSSVCGHPGDSHKLVAIFGGHDNCIHYVYIVRWRLLNVPISIQYVCMCVS